MLDDVDQLHESGETNQSKCEAVYEYRADV